MTNYGSMLGMVGREPDTGPTAQTVATNVKALREAQNMNYKQLSQRLEDSAGWAINAVGIRRIESGERRVTIDDLISLALALGVSPISLLMPSSVEGSDHVGVTGIDDDVEAKRLWRWLTADYPLTGESPEAVLAFILRSLPHWHFREQFDVVESGLEPDVTTTIVRRHRPKQV